MEKLVYNKAIDSWEKITEDKSAEPISQQVELFRKMLGIFQIGESFYLIIDVAKTKIDFCDVNVLNVLGYRPKEMSLALILESIHPDDLPVFMDYEVEVSGFFSKLDKDKIQKYKVRYDYRMRTKKGVYKRLMHQAIPIEVDERGAVVKTLAVYSDIGYLKRNKTMSLSILGMEGEPSFLRLKSTKPLQRLNNPLSPRELEVLKLIGKGNSSKNIADKLKLSEHTVKNHRKNMLRKTGVSSSAGLLSKALENTWI
jgi:DNA-binding CsgD family transcriptional regulator